jgi:plasmid stabilization system protein ParE
MPGISWTGPALTDLRNIDAWLDDVASPAVAERILSAIHRRARFLENFPHGGRPSQNGNRVLLVFGTPYLILYRIVGGHVQVLRVHHEREDWLIEP